MEEGRSSDKVVTETVLKRTGIFGGTFDPVHLGHIGLAQDAMEQAGLDKVIFIPAAHQPFKLDRETASGEHRLEMLKLALKDIAGLEISEYELEEKGISYTYLTMRAMRRMMGEDTRLYFITGTDSFLKIEQWKNSSELLREFSYIIGTRPGYRQEELDECVSRIRNRYGTEIIFLNNTQLDISSTEIRERLEQGVPAGDLIPAEVERYITEHGLYRN
ncbi:MAG: nicotinate-nucleotide adenylyltransferase [Lentihominibacter sp.]